MRKHGGRLLELLQDNVGIRLAAIRWICASLSRFAQNLPDEELIPCGVVMNGGWKLLRVGGIAQPVDHVALQELVQPAGPAVWYWSALRFVERWCFVKHQSQELNHDRPEH
jgi:hypothetical protein